MKSPKIKLPVTSYQLPVSGISRGFTPTPFGVLCHRVFRGGNRIVTVPYVGNQLQILSLTRRKPYPERCGGFTMIELLVTVAIFTMMTSVLLANYPKFSSRILLENTAHSIGLSVRQAQTYGLNVRGVRVGATDIFPTYGIHFSPEGVNAIDPSDRKRFLLFADILPNPSTPTLNNRVYDAVSDCSIPGGECRELFSIQNAEQIYLLCGNLKSTGATIENWESVPGADCTLTALDIAYTRPDPDASIKGTSAFTGPETTFTDGEIVVRSPRGEYKTVVVWSTGQISVE